MSSPQRTCGGRHQPSVRFRALCAQPILPLLNLISLALSRLSHSLPPLSLSHARTYRFSLLSTRVFIAFFFSLVYDHWVNYCVHHFVCLILFPVLFRFWSERVNQLARNGCLFVQQSVNNKKSIFSQVCQTTLCTFRRLTLFNFA